jgi:hypothetical protein
MRVLIAALIGGIVMFIWGAAAHTVLGLGQIGIHQPTNEDVVLNAMYDGLGTKPGIYILPSVDMKHWHDPAVQQAYAEKTKVSPYVWMVYMPLSDDLTQIGPQLGRQWASDTLAALAVAFMMGLAALSFAKRVTIALAAAVFAWLTTGIPYWNWFRFPLDFTLTALAIQLIGWLLAGAAMAWWIGSLERRGV